MSSGREKTGDGANFTVAETGKWRVLFEPPREQPLRTGFRERWFDVSLHLSTAEGSTGGNEIYRLRWREGEAEISFRSSEIRVRPARPGLQRRSLQRFVETQIMPRILAHDGELILHAGTVEVDGTLCAFPGPSGTGKSTLVASLLSAGHPLVGDDALRITKTQSGFGGSPVFAGLWLLPDSLGQLFPDQHRTRSAPGHARKTGIAFAKSRALDPLPLRTVYVLAQSDRIAIRRMKPSEACMAIIANSFALDPTDFGCSSARLAAATKLVEEVAVFELSYPRHYDWLNAVRDEILRHCNQRIVHIEKSRS